jgi:hypothetical protein
MEHHAFMNEACHSEFDLYYATATRVPQMSLITGRKHMEVGAKNIGTVWTVEYTVKENRPRTHMGHGSLSLLTWDGDFEPDKAIRLLIIEEIDIDAIVRSKQFIIKFREKHMDINTSHPDRYFFDIIALEWDKWGVTAGGMDF